MTGRAHNVGLEEIETTMTEKLLAVVLTAFFLVGGIWAYTKLDDLGDRAYRTPESYFTASERSAVDASQAAQTRAGTAEIAAGQARQELELAREAYRTGLDAGQDVPELRRSYETAQQRFDAATAEQAEARQAAAAAQPAATAAYDRASAEAERASRRDGRLAFGLRLAFVLGSLGAGYWFLLGLRRTGSRYLPVGFALVGYAAILALVLAGDYFTDYIDVAELGPLVLSVAGIAFTLVAFWWLQRYLARRLPGRRVRKAECPFCGYPARGAVHCEGCGRTVLGECTTCHGPRRVGTHHCGACGAT